MSRFIDFCDIFKYPDNFIGRQVRVAGTIKTARQTAKILFAELSDGTCKTHLQLIFTNLENTKSIKTGCSIEITGKIKKSPAAGQFLELLVENFICYEFDEDSADYPIAKTELSLEYLRQYPNLRIRTDTFSSISRIKSKIKFAMAEFFNSKKFAYDQPVLLTDNECESGSCPFMATSLLSKNMRPDNPVPVDFSKDFFGKPVYLTVSSQLHLETRVCGGLRKAWINTTCFRAEPSMTRFHAAEFEMVEYEFCFCDLEDNMRITEDCLKYCLSRILVENLDDLEFLQSKYKPDLIETLKKYSNNPFIKTTHESCIKMMLQDQSAGLIQFTKTPAYDEDLSKEHELYITKKYGMPVFCQYFPEKIKAFYMKIIDPGNPICEHVDCFDLLVPEIGEIVGGSQRETNHKILLTRMAKFNIDPEPLKFYTDIRKYSCPPHGGAGIGLDRFIMVCTGIQNIRDMIGYPRTYTNCIN